MKLKTGCLIIGLCCCTMLSAQDRPSAINADGSTSQLPREIPSPEGNARKITNAMKKGLSLTDKQYDKLYKLNLKEQRELFGNKQQARQGGPRSGGQGMGGRPPGGGGQMGGGMGGGRMGGGQPPMGGGQRPSMDGEGQGMPGGAAKEKTEKDLQKAAAKKEKKIKKILTNEQYEKWQNMSAEFTRPAKGGHPERPERQQGERQERPERPEL